MRTMMALFAALIVLLGIAIFLLSIILTDLQKSPPQTPSVKTEQQADGALKGQGNPSDQTKSSPDAAVGQHQPSAASEAKSHGQLKEGAHEASEFWTIGGRSLKITDTLLVVFTFCLFLATVALFWATRDLVEDAKHSGEVNSRNMQAAIAESSRSADAAKASADAARDAVKLAESTAQQQLRAYVLISEAKVILTDNRLLDAAITVKNFGQTPAYEYGAMLSMSTRGEGSTKPLPPLEGAIIPKGSLGPGGIGHPRNVIGFDPSVIEMLKNNKGRIFVYGRLTYLDIFKRRHTYEFKFQSIGFATTGDHFILEAISGEETDE